MKDVLSFNEKRAVKQKNSKLWSPADALRATLRDIESGKINPTEIAIWSFSPKEDGGQRINYCVAGMDRQGHVYLLNHALRVVLTECIEE